MDWNQTWTHRALSRIFGNPEEINGRERCPTYLFRWVIWKDKPGTTKAYIHHFVGDDWSLDLHDHPRKFVSIGLWGSYNEERPSGSGTVIRNYMAPWFRSFPAEHIHRISLIDGRPCWTLVVVFPITRGWGFWNNRKFVPWKQYVDSETADERKSCNG